MQWLYNIKEERYLLNDYYHLDDGHSQHYFYYEIIIGNEMNYCQLSKLNKGN